MGRADEVAALDDLVGAAIDGRGGALALVGDPGAGKSALLRYCAASAASRGVRVLRASGVEFEAVVGFSLLQQLLLPLVDDFAALAPRERAALSVALGFEDGPAQEFGRVRDAALALVLHAAGCAPLLLAVDDVQFADRNSARVLQALPDALRHCTAGLVVAARRDGERQRPLVEACTSVEIGPLDRRDAARLLARAHPGIAPEVRSRLLAAADGNPLALLELPAPLTAGQRSAAEPLPDPLPLSHRLQRMYQDRVAALPAPSRRLLLLVALEPGTALSVLAPAFAGHTPSQAAKALVDAGLADVEGDMLLLRHPLVGTAVVAGATPEERANAHRTLSTVLTGHRGDAERRVWHLAEATGEPDETVATLLERFSALLLRRGDSSAAMALLVRAAELSVEQDERVRRLSRAAYAGAGVDLAAAEGILESVRASDPSFSGSLTTALAAATVIAEGDGDVDVSHRVLTRAIDAYANRTDPGDAVLMEAIGTLRWVCWLGGRPEMWRDYHTALDRLVPGPPPLIDLAARTSPDPARTTDEVLRRVEETVAALDSVDDPALIVQMAETSYVYDRIRDCRPALERVVEGARRGGPALMGVWALLMIGLDAFHRGRWSDACDSAVEARTLARDGRYNVQGWSVDYELALLAAGRGRDAEAAELADRIARWAMPRRARTPLAYVSHVQTLAASGRGDFESAFRHAESISPAGEFASHAWLALVVCLDLVEASVRTGRVEAARAHAAAARAIGMERFSPRSAMVVLAVRALVADPAEAARLFERALAVPGAADWRFDYARVQLMYGSHLRRNQAVAASRAPLRQAQAAFERLGARPWADRARGELAATAESRGAAGAASGNRQLTPQEREIAELAASGLTNKKIAERLGISHRTVGNHLYQVYTKLEITSRGGLRDALDGQPTRQRGRPPQ